MKTQAPTFEHLRQRPQRMALRQAQTVGQKPAPRVHSHATATQKPSDSGPIPPGAILGRYVPQHAPIYRGPIGVPLRDKPAERGGVKV